MTSSGWRKIIHMSYTYIVTWGQREYYKKKVIDSGK
jgi:hypothetical protein